jgi:hypothetical protein
VLWLLYEPSGAEPRLVVHEYVRVGPPFDEVQVTLTLVTTCPPADAPVMLTPRSCDCAEVSNADTAAGCAGVPHARKLVFAADAELTPPPFVLVAVQV